MKYSFRYCNSIKQHLKAADEITIIYDRQDTALLDFLAEYNGQRIILVVEKVKDFEIHQEWKKLDAIHEKYPEYDIQVCFGQEAPIEEVAAITANLSLPWFSTKPLVTWDQLHYYLGLGVAQVYIAEDLGFELEKVAALCRKYNAEIRVFPNVGQASIKQAPALTKFFIRPEDVDAYEPYIDTFEFWCEDAQQFIYRKIYENRLWYGELREIIKDFNSDIDSKRMMPLFGATRVNCGKRCLKGGHCNICGKIYDISKALEQSNMIITKKNRSV